MAPIPQAIRRLAWLGITIFAAGCQSVYFKPADPPAGRFQYALTDLPFSEYWTGIVFNGEKIGFTRYGIRPSAADQRRYEILSQASFVLHFLGIEKSIQLKSRDLVDGNLMLIEFAYDYNIDGSELKLSGIRTARNLRVTVTSGGKQTVEEHPADTPLYPSSAITLVPVVRGLVPERRYEYRVFDGQTQTVAEVVQRVSGYETSEFFEGSAFKVETSMHNQSTTTWIDARGRPVFELGMRGAMISALEDEQSARRYLALAALNKQEALVEFSVIRPEETLSRPREVSRLSVAIEGLDRTPPSNPLQQCRREGVRDLCDIRSREPLPAAAEDDANATAKYLSGSITVQSHDPAIRQTAREIAPDPASPPVERIARILVWMERNVEKAPIDVFSALDVLEKKRAECQGHAYLFAALARALDIPTRVVNGLAYSDSLNGFLYHSWVESLIDGAWRPIDPTFGQLRADATHIKLIEGERLADLLPLIDWVGRLKISVRDVAH